MPLDPAVRVRVTLRNFSVAMVLLLGLFAAFEITARLVVFGVGGLDPRRIGILHDVAPIEFVTFDTQPSIVYEHKPDLDAFSRLVRFRTNSRGLRDDEYPLAKPPGAYRVAVLGSSFTVPAGVEIEDAFHSRLERRFAAEHFEFLNFAVGMHLPSQFIGMLLHRALAYDPDLILVSATSLSARFFLLDWDRPARSNAIWKLGREPRSVFFQWLGSRLASKPPSPAWLRPGARPSMSPTGMDVISKLGEISRETGIPVIIVRLEFDPRPPTDLEREVERRAKGAGLRYVDTRVGFEGKEPQGFWVNEFDPHPNAAAHAIFADVIGSFLRDQGLIAR